MENYLELQAEDTTNAQLHMEIMKLQAHQQLILKQGRWQEILRITRVPSGWIYETSCGRLFGGRNTTFVPYL